LAPDYKTIADFRKDSEPAINPIPNVIDGKLNYASRNSSKVGYQHIQQYNQMALSAP
jgi:hypothetical protein